MTKISLLIAIIWVWHCVAYGQLSVNYNPYCIPYISTFVTPHNHQNYDETVDQLFERNSPFQGALFVKMKKLEAIAANLAKQLKDTTAKLEKNVSDLKDELKIIANIVATKDDLAKKADQSELVKTNAELQTNSNQLETTRRNLASTMTEMSSTKSAVVDLTKMLNDRTSEIVDIGQMPTSCFDLEGMGHKLSGFFSVKGSEKMEMIYCDFNPNNQNEKEKRIGYVDVKSEPVYFYVQRNSNFNTKGTPIPFQLAVVNEGNAMDLTTGKFTAPRTGVYFFTFTGHASFDTSEYQQLAVGLYLNGGRIGVGYVSKGVNVDSQWSPLTLQSTLNLKENDQVWVTIDWQTAGAYLFDNFFHFIHFTGFMLQEERAASL